MSREHLKAHELALVCKELGRHPEIREAILFGSRAKGVHRPESDIDLALVGVTDTLTAAAIAEALKDLPLPYRFDVQAYDALQCSPLIDHIARVGVVIYRREPQA